MTPHSRCSPAQAASAAIEAYWSIGGERIEIDAGTITWHPTTPAVDLGNFLSLHHRPTQDTLPTALQSFAAVTGYPCTKIIKADELSRSVPTSEPMTRWSTASLINMKLDDEPPAAAGDIGLDPVHTDGEWARVRELFRIDHQEEDDRAGRPHRAAVITEMAIELRRILSLEATYFLARSGDDVVGTIALWTRSDGVSVIEDVFVHPDRRHRGVATAMIIDVISRARSEGNESIFIAAEANDTPRYLYESLGFAAVSTTSVWSPSLGWR